MRTRTYHTGDWVPAGRIAFGCAIIVSTEDPSESDQDVAEQAIKVLESIRYRGRRRRAEKRRRIRQNPAEMEGD